MQIEDFKLFLMIDDNDDELFLTKAILQISHPLIDFVGEKNASQAVAQLGRAAALGTPAAQICVLLDIRMPGTNGFEVIYRLRNEIQTYDCCIVMLSASRGLADRDHAEAIGADGYLAKPFTVAKLRAVLEQCRPAADAA